MFLIFVQFPALVSAAPPTHRHCRYPAQILVAAGGELQQKTLEPKLRAHADGHRLSGNAGEDFYIVVDSPSYSDVRRDAVDEAVSINIHANRMSAIKTVRRAHLNQSGEYGVAA